MVHRTPSIRFASGKDFAFVLADELIFLESLSSIQAKPGNLGLTYQRAPSDVSLQTYIATSTVQDSVVILVHRIQHFGSTA